MDEKLCKETIGRALTNCIAEAREVRASRASDVSPADFSRLKEWQAARLARSYADLLADRRYNPAAAFFLSDLYGPKDFRTDVLALAGIPDRRTAERQRQDRRPLRLETGLPVRARSGAQILFGG